MDAEDMKQRLDRLEHSGLNGQSTCRPLPQGQRHRLPVTAQRRRTRSGLLGLGAAVLGMALTLAGCTGSEVKHDDPYAAEFAQARSEAKNDFVRQVLDDDVITEAEYKETQQRYVNCMADGGVTVRVVDTGGYSSEKQLVGAVAELESNCSDMWLIPIEALYGAIRVNPNREDFDELTVACLRRQGVVDDSFTKENWVAIVNEFAAGHGAEAPRSTWPTLPGGIPMDDPRVQLCWNTPLDG